MSDAREPARSLRLSDLDPIAVAGGLFHPVRRALGARAFGINAYGAEAVGDQLIEEHDETGSGSGGHEELYVVIQGHAAFTVDGDEIDAPSGTLVFVPDVRSRRSAVALEPGTVALVIGGPAARPLPVSPFEYWFVAEKPFRDGDMAAAIATLSEGLEQWPDHPVIHYQLACCHALAGNGAENALHHLAIACAGDARAREWARTDTDFESLFDEPGFVDLVG